MAEKWTPPEGTDAEDVGRMERMTRIYRDMILVARHRLEAASVAPDREWELTKWRVRVDALTLEGAESLRVLR